LLEFAHIAKLNEAKQGALIQAVDPAIPPNSRSFPKRGLIVISPTKLPDWSLLRSCAGLSRTHEGGSRCKSTDCTAQTSFGCGEAERVLEMF